ncbi:hypothetical protein [Ruminococcus sp.]|uniref:hypothetical protein n=1 Tax=Ruminococcus sp. TaxID=41978 RepID=UPI002C47C0FC|nr:hypothetical protein [Ruminococcus sp.]HNZ98807.1 hypothetical protein [Ruminococcus sp.]
MKKILFYIAVFAAYLIMGYVTLRYIYFGILGNNAHFFGSPTKEEKRKSYLWLLGPVAVMIAVQGVVLLLGRKCFDTWGWKERLITIAAAVLGAVLSVPVLSVF